VEAEDDENQYKGNTQTQTAESSLVVTWPVGIIWQPKNGVPAKVMMVRFIVMLAMTVPP